VTSRQHYFSSEPAAPSEPRRIAISLPGRDVTLVTDTSVFSRDRLDPGTAALLRYAPLPERGTLLDLGCGYGPIGVSLALRSPASAVWCVDVNRRALALTAENARALGLANVVAAAPEDVPPDLRFDAIYSNPPIRVGRPALEELLVRWLSRLAPGGAAHLVVSRHLGADSLERWLRASGWPSRRARSKAGYRLLEVTRGG
jgi:16S rRNA (guanine1207-N2)-methyltransferase